MFHELRSNMGWPVAERPHTVVGCPVAAGPGAGGGDIYSASIAIAEAGRHTGNQPLAYFLTRHGIYVLVGIVMGVGCRGVPMRVWQRPPSYLFLRGGRRCWGWFSFPVWAGEVNGSQRWLRLGVVNLQPLGVHEAGR